MIRLHRRGLLLGGAAVAGFGTCASRIRPARAQSRLVIATGGTGGVFYPYGGGLAKILTEKAAGIQATSEVTGGSVDNNKLLGAGDADLGFSTLDSAYDALKGEGAYKDVGPQAIATLAVLYDSFLHVVASQASGITRIADLKGRRVSVGSAGSSTESIADRVLAAAGLNPASDVQRDNLGVAESVGALKDGKVEAFFWIGGVPTAAVRDLASTGASPIRFVPTEAEFNTLQSQFPNLYRPFTLAPNSYQGQTEAVQGLGVANVLVVPASMDGELVKTILGTLFDNLAAVQEIHPEAKKFALATAKSETAVPFHPAAVEFYAGRN